MPKLGDCYEANARFVMDKASDMKLAHGTAIGEAGTGIDGIEFGHAWVEDGNKIYDLSNGKLIFMNKKEYYKLGKIKNVTLYTIEQLLVNILKYKHWGPWKGRWA